MKVSTKTATIENTGDAEEFPGTFRVVLSTGKKDRDGEEVKRDEWMEPLPDHITFDADHALSVAGTVGSGKPYFDDQDRLLVDGTYSSLQKAQDVRTLVNEGHIRHVSVAFNRHTSTEKDGAKTVKRELLNGAFVAIPANTDAVVLGSKTGARHSAADMGHLQAAHDALVAAGVSCGPSDDTGAAEGATGGKSAVYDGRAPKPVTKGANVGQQFESRIHQDFTNRADDMAAHGMLTRDERIALSGAIGAGLGAFNDHLQENAPHLYERDPWTDPASIAKSVRVAYAKAAQLEPPAVGDDPERLAEATDAALDEAMNFADGVDTDAWPDDARQFLHLVTAAWATIGEALEASGGDDPDADDNPADDTAAEADATKSATKDSGGNPGEAGDTDSLQLRAQALAMAALVASVTA